MQNEKNSPNPEPETPDYKVLWEQQRVVIKELEAKLAAAKKRADGFRDLAAASAMLDQRITGPNGIQSN